MAAFSEALGLDLKTLRVEEVARSGIDVILRTAEFPLTSKGLLLLFAEVE